MNTVISSGIVRKCATQGERKSDAGHGMCFWSMPGDFKIIYMIMLDTMPSSYSPDKEQGVVNEFGEVWNYPNLYVSDGSIIPTALSVNPSATISALSERIAAHIAGS